MKLECLQKKYFNKEPDTKEFEYISNAIEHICKNLENRDEAIQIALKLLDPFSKGKAITTDLEKYNNSQIEDTNNKESTAANTTEQPKERNIKPNDNAYEYVAEDLNFFKQISIVIEKRSQAPLGKIELINKVALKMNELSGNKVEQRQLQAAIYLYDWGSCTLPVSIITKKEMLTEQEMDLIKKCPLISITILNNIPFWLPAAKIIEQCHERVDGTGYPNKTSKEQICDGAKILAIANSFGSAMLSHISKETLEPLWLQF